MVIIMLALGICGIASTETEVRSLKKNSYEFCNELFIYTQRNLKGTLPNYNSSRNGNISHLHLGDEHAGA